MTHTLIFEIPNRKQPYHICFTDDGEKYLENLKYGSHGFYADMNIKDCRVVFACKGDYVKGIKRMGLIGFMSAVRNETPLITLGLNILS